MLTTVPSDEVIAAAAAIANARGNRRGVPTITNIFDILPDRLKEEVLEDAAAALEAVEELRRRKGDLFERIQAGRDEIEREKGILEPLKREDLPHRAERLAMAEMLRPKRRKKERP